MLLGQINLQKYLDSMIVNFEGEDGIFIPFRHNPSIFVGRKGVYANIIIKPTTSDNFGNSHLVAATVKKDILDSMSESEKRLKTPILGNLKDYSSSGTPGVTIRPHAEKSTTKRFNDTSVIDKYDDCEDLPL